MMLFYAGLGLIALAHLVAIGALVALASGQGRSTSAVTWVALAEGLELLACALVVAIFTRHLPDPLTLAPIWCWGGGVVVFLISAVVVAARARQDGFSGGIFPSVLLAGLLHLAGPGVIFFAFASSFRISM